MKKNLLVIDDEREIRSLISVVARDEFNVLESSCGLEALEMLESHQVDVILTDYFMPSMNGLELVKVLSEKSLEIPIIVMTGHGSLDLHGRMLASKVYDYVTKPFRFDELLETIHRSLGMNAEPGIRRDNIFTHAYYDKLNLSLSKGSADWVAQKSLEKGVSVSTYFDELIRQIKFEAGES